MYLQSVFDKVYTVQGKIVSDFRKIWGIQDEYEKKSRINHIHHCIDAVTISCITRDNYDALAHYYYQIESAENRRGEYKPSGFPKPWSTFTQDIKELDKKVLTSHHTPDNLLVQSKKKLRKKGVVQYNHKNQPIYQQGDTVRGSLHKETYYGAIENSESGEDKQVRYVLRKDLNSLRLDDIKNIVDPVVRGKIESAIKGKIFKEALSSTIWMNQEKEIPIKKVRCFAPTVTNPIALKKHRDLSNKNHKQNFYVMNDTNYIMAIYEHKYNAKIIKDYEIVNNLEAIKKYKENKDFISQNKIKSGKNIPLKYIIKKGTMVIFVKIPDEKYSDLSDSEINKRLYKVMKFDNRPRITCRHHMCAKPAKDIKEKFIFDFETPIEQVSLSLTNFNVLVEGYDFKINDLGEIYSINE